MTEPVSSASIITRAPAAFPLILSVLAALVAIGAIMGWGESRTFVLLLAFAVPVGLIARRTANSTDGNWLPNLIVLAWAVKLVFAAARYWVLQVLYQGVGDASRYHNAGIRLAKAWESRRIPAFEDGTEFVETVTGLLYGVHQPTKLGGFFVFATLAFLGQVLFYASFRRAFPAARLKWYAGLIFFFPNVLFWPASIGKESLMMVFVGVSVYGAARILREGRLRWMVPFAIGVALCVAIRSHIALALVVALVFAVLFGRSIGPAHRRLGAIALLVLLGLTVGRIATQDLGVQPVSRISESLFEDVVDPVFANVEDQTNQGGSAVAGRAIRSPADIPSAVLRVLFRPLPNEAHNGQSLVNSLIEGTLLLAVLLWRAPTIIREFPRLWRHPYVVFCMVYTLGFIYGHSAILNLGIMARQRSQVIPFVLVLLVGLGFSSASPLPVEDREAPRHAPLFTRLTLR